MAARTSARVVGGRQGGCVRARDVRARRPGPSRLHPRGRAGRASGSRHRCGWRSTVSTTSGTPSRQPPSPWSWAPRWPGSPSCWALPGRSAAAGWRVTERADGVTVVDDAYNANPDSVRAALAALTAMARPRGRRSWAVLGEMLELGPAAPTEHDDLGRLAVHLGVSRLVAVGEGGPGLSRGSPPGRGTGRAGDLGARPGGGPRAAAPPGRRLGTWCWSRRRRAIGLDVLARALVADGVPVRPGAAVTVEDEAAMSSADGLRGGGAVKTVLVASAVSLICSCSARRCSSASWYAGGTGSSSGTTDPRRTTPSAARRPWVGRS